MKLDEKLPHIKNLLEIHQSMLKIELQLQKLWRSDGPYKVRKRQPAEPTPEEKTEYQLAEWRMNKHGEKIPYKNVMHSYGIQHTPHDTIWTTPRILKQLQRLPRQDARIALLETILIDRFPSTPAALHITPVKGKRYIYIIDTPNNHLIIKNKPRPKTTDILYMKPKISHSLNKTDQKDQPKTSEKTLKGETGAENSPIYAILARDPVKICTYDLMILWNYDKSSAEYLETLISKNQTLEDILKDAPT